MPDTVDIRAQIDTEQVRALQIINGGGAAGLMTLLPNVVASPELYALAVSMVFAIGFSALGLFFATVHNRLRRKCSLEYDRGTNRQAAAKWWILRIWASVPNEPRICTFSVIWMWTSMLLFLCALASVSIGAWIVIRPVSS